MKDLCFGVRRMERISSANHLFHEKRYPFPITGVLAFVLVLSILVSITGCGKSESQGKIKVAASIVPIGDFCERVGGDLVEVETMVPPGASPHTFEPTSSQVRFLSDASVFVYNGLGLEKWITDMVRKVGGEGLVEVEASANIPSSDLIEVDGEREGEENGERDRGNGVYDPHVWLDPNLAALQVEAIRDGFIDADPENEKKYRRNTDEYLGELEKLDEYVRGETSTFTKKKFVSFHPAFTYYASRYGLEQVEVIEELPGKEPSAHEIADIIDAMKEQGVQVIFTEPQFSPRAAEAIAAESGADVVLRALDPLGDPDDPGVSTYVKLIKHDTSVMAGAMR